MRIRLGATSGTEPSTGADEGEDDRVAQDPSRRPPREVFGVSFDDARIELLQRLHSLLIGGGRGRLEVRDAPVERLLRIARSGPVGIH